MGSFYADMLSGIGFHIQWVPGDYKVAEASFLKINTGGQGLDPLEITLIRHRNSSFARAVMSIAHGGTGHFWPDDINTPRAKDLLEEVMSGSQKLHGKLFVPPLAMPIRDANVPFMVAPGYFTRHQYLLEILPVIQGLNGSDEDIDYMLTQDEDSDPETILDNGAKLIRRGVETFAHLTGTSADSKSLSIVPLFYFYSIIGRYVRSALYGFISWFMSGNDEDILVRKIVFSAHRGRFENVMFEEDFSGAITGRIGSGTRATQGTAEFYDRLLRLLDTNPSPINDESFRKELNNIKEELTAPRLRKSASKEGRQVDDTRKSTVNIKELFETAIRCEICGGVLDLRAGTQYDHITRHSQGGLTDSRNLRATHPFCNNQRDAIELHQNGVRKLNMPRFIKEKLALKEMPAQFDFFNNLFFPDEE
jgi:5-methylcytosine-specific restriction endonuclease McrA